VRGHVNISVHQGAASSCRNQWQLVIHHITCTCKFITPVPRSFLWLAPICLTSLLQIKALFLQNTANLIPQYNASQHRPQQEYQLSYTNSHTCLSLRYFEVLTAVMLNIQLFRHVTLCCWASRCQHFKQSQCLHLQCLAAQYP
jgi:hypothetical protein